MTIAAFKLRFSIQCTLSVINYDSLWVCMVMSFLVWLKLFWSCPCTGWIPLWCGRREGGGVCVLGGGAEGGWSCNHLHNVLLLACTAAREGALKAALGIIPVPRRKKVIDAHTMLIFNSGAENIGFLDEAELRRCKRILNAALHVASNLSRLQSSLTGKC